MTPTTIIDRVLTRLGESTTSPNFWTRAELLNYLDEGQKEFVKETEILTQKAIIEIVANQAQYALPTDMIRPVRVLYNDKTEIIPYSPLELDLNDTSWEADTGTPEYFYHCDTRHIYITPVPTGVGDAFSASQETGVVASITAPDTLHSVRKQVQHWI